MIADGWPEGTRAAAARAAGALASELAAPPKELDLPPLKSSDSGELGADVEYRAGQANAETRDDYERLISAWLEEAKPGAFFSRDGGDIYKKPHLMFTAHQADNIYQANSIDDFEIALSRRGYRTGVFVHKYLETWILLLPGRSPAKRTVPATAEAKAKPLVCRQEDRRRPLDESFKDLIGADSLSVEDADALLEVLASHEVTPSS